MLPIVIPRAMSLQMYSRFDSFLGSLNITPESLIRAPISSASTPPDMRFYSVASLIATAIASVQAGPLTHGLCQTGAHHAQSLGTCYSLIHVLLGCNTMAVVCYAAAGFTFGTIAAPLAPPAIVACNATLGTCTATCATVALLAPTP
jgi:hypothetical protein